MHFLDFIVVGSEIIGETSGAVDYQDLVKKYQTAQVKSKAGPTKGKDKTKKSQYFSVS